MGKKYQNKLKFWQESIKNFLFIHPERKLKFSTNSELPVDRLYVPTNEDNEYVLKLGFPGYFPFTRGVQPTMYRGRFWTMRQYAGFGSALESNRRYRYLLEAGQTGLSVAFDLPTQIGYDADHKMAQGEVGKVGVNISSLRDMEILFNKIPLDKVSTSMTINAPAGILLAMYIAIAEKKNIKVDNLKGTIQNDILKEYSSRGTYIFPPKPSMRIITDIFAYCAKKLPQWNTISISGYHIREAGSTAVQEVAFTLANGLSYIQTAIEAGLDINKFGPRLSFFFNAHSDFFEEIAKYRAARRLWANLIKKRFKVKDQRCMMLRFHTQTAGCTLTAQQPINNVTRVAFQALSSVLGGTQSLHTNSMDEAFSLPSTEAATTALRTQQIIAYETGITNTIDPLAGSYYLEYLTNEIEEQANEYIIKIDEMGGAVEAIERGFIQKEIQEAAYTYQKSIEKNERIIVGINKFVNQEKFTGELLRVNPKVGNDQSIILAKIRAERDNTTLIAKLTALKKAAQEEENLMPHFLNCVHSYATLGEICNVLRDVFGEYQAPQTI